MAITVSVGGIHLVNSTGVPVAGGVATAAATTPFSIREGWTLEVAEPNAIYGGGPPFRMGSSLAYLGYDNVACRIPIQVIGSDHENAVARLQELKLALTTGLTTNRPLLGIQPTASSTIAYSTIEYGFVRELTGDEGRFQAWEGTVEITAEIIFTRSPFFGRLTTPETVLSAVTMTNTGTGGSSNIRAYSAGSGDLANEGQPLNVQVTLPGGAGGPPDANRNVYIASVLSRTYSTTFAGSQTTSDTVDGDLIGGQLSVSLTTALTNRLKARFIMRNTSASAAAEFQVQVTAPGTVYVGPWVPARATGTHILDLGWLDLAFIRRSRNITAPTMSVQFSIRSSTGGSVSATCTYGEVLLYYTFANLTFLQIPTGGGSFITDTFAEQSGAACLPFPTERTLVYSGTDMLEIGRKAGMLPRYVTGASLWLAWWDTLGNHTTSETATVTSTHAPLWRGLRGAD